MPSLEYPLTMDARPFSRVFIGVVLTAGCVSDICLQTDADQRGVGACEEAGEGKGPKRAIGHPLGRLLSCARDSKLVLGALAAISPFPLITAVTILLVALTLGVLDTPYSSFPIRGSRPTSSRSTSRASRVTGDIQAVPIHVTLWAGRKQTLLQSARTDRRSSRKGGRSMPRLHQALEFSQA